MLAALHGCHGNDVIEQGIDQVGFLRGGQSTLHDLRVVQHVVDLVGQALSCHLYGIYVRPDFGGDIFSNMTSLIPRTMLMGVLSS